MRSFRASWSKWKSRADRIIPSNRQIVVWLLLGLFSLETGAVNPRFGWIGFVLFGVFAALVLIDLSLAHKQGFPEVHREFSGTPQNGLPMTVHLHVSFAGSKRSGRSTRLPMTQFDIGEPETFRFIQALTLNRVHDRQSHGSGQSQGSGQSHGSSQGQEPSFGEPSLSTSIGSAFTAELSPTVRGPQEFASTDCRFSSPVGMWTCMHRDDNKAQLLVLPDVTSWRDEVESLMKTLFQEGRHVKRLASGDTDFAYISEYGIDDDLRTVNWAATARRTRLMKNVYEPERGQHIIIAIDASRYMAVELPDGKTRLDHAVDCASALAHTALRMGDSVGIIGFSDKVDLRIAPDNGKDHWRLVVDGLARLQPQAVQGGYQALFSSLAGQFRRRSLLIVLSEMEGLATDAGFLPAIRAAKQQHPTIFVSILPNHLHELLECALRTEDDVAEWAAVEWLLEERDELKSVLHRGGVEVIEAPPNQLVTKVVTSYLRKKRRGSL
ncbi:DUF58 domain-containing protein [Alicyclobacillus mengziensis]|uniref:DUF58 domain-containing protein n=1 Tax=Alicyclobacillus mengziensis TaxID=2931921 RepID=A0A9X7VWL5_9BACL|nr:DUF58 domain-containing protein [Alicyclobacillus mengziensis]QSO46423.1 DUF58 domain-containing protein [Alicyclobacillus mengziensis]